MKLDYLKDGSDDCPLVRLYEFETTEVLLLKKTFEALADGVIEQANLDAVKSVDGSSLTFFLNSQDREITEASPSQFEVVLSSEGWRQAAELIEPFCNGCFGYQWLVPQARGIKFLLSKDGCW